MLVLFSSSCRPVYGQCEKMPVDVKRRKEKAIVSVFFFCVYSYDAAKYFLIINHTINNILFPGGASCCLRGPNSEYDDPKGT